MKVIQNAALAQAVKQTDTEIRTLLETATPEMQQFLYRVHMTMSVLNDTLAETQTTLDYITTKLTVTK